MYVTPHGTSAQFDIRGLPYEPYLLTAEMVAGLRHDFARRGIAVFGPPALNLDIYEAVAVEAAEQRKAAAWPLSGGGERGKIQEQTMRGHLGPGARELMAAGATRALIKAVTGRTVQPGWSASCFTYYDEPGKYLGSHCDKEDACAVAMLSCVDARWPAGQDPGPGLQLRVYRDRTPHDLQLKVTSLPNRIVIFAGSVLAHERPAVAKGESVTTLCGCYEVVA